MGILKVANVHFSNTQTIKIEHVTSDNVLRITANAMLMPVGTTSNRPTGTPGLIRYNSSLGQFEGYNASTWGAIGGGSAGDAVAAFLKGNVAHETANAAFLSANTGQIIANAAFVSGNSGQLTANTAYTKGNAAHLTANTSYDKGNAAHSTANSALTLVGIANTTANTIGTGTYAFTGTKTHAGTETFNGATVFNAAVNFGSTTTTNNHVIINYAIPTVSSYSQGLQLEISTPNLAGGNAGIGLLRTGLSHCGIYHDTTNTLKFNMNSGTVTLNHNAGTLWGNGNDGAGSGLDADLLDGYQASQFALLSGATFTGETYCNAGLHATIFRDRDDPNNYYVDPTGVSFCNDFRAAIFYQRNDVNSYWGTNDFALRGASPTLRLRDTDQYGCAIHNNGNVLYILGTPIDDPTWRTINGQWPFIFNLANNDATCGGNFYSVGNVVAYSSDKRLKENFRYLNSALSKINQLTGYVFDWKDMVETVNFVPSKMKDEIGLIAQDVQKVCPQAVTRAGFDTEYDSKTDSYKSRSGKEYLTVQYEKLVPLLVEAIKELSREVEILKSKQ
jgi:hypothetical protein